MRTQILSHLLLIWLILMTFQQHYAISFGFQESKSDFTQAAPFWISVAVSIKINPEANNSRIMGVNSRRALRNKREAIEKKVRKTPSGPSPVGNHRPPSRG